MEQPQRKPKSRPGSDCLLYYFLLLLISFSCRVSGCATCLGISAYTYNIYRKTPLTKVGDRRFSLVMSLGFAALGVYRAFLY